MLFLEWTGVGVIGGHEYVERRGILDLLGKLSRRCKAEHRENPGLRFEFGPSGLQRCCEIGGSRNRKRRVDGRFTAAPGSPQGENCAGQKDGTGSSRIHVLVLDSR
jgi:hypothetical protein